MNPSINYVNIFKLPIEYIKNVSILEDNILDDLELIKSKDMSGTSLYYKIFSSNDISNNNSNNDLNETFNNLNVDKDINPFSIEIAKKSAKFYTNNKKYLKDTSKIIKYFKHSELNNNLKKKYDYYTLYNTFNDIICDKSFVEKYYYIENSFLKHFNYNSQILQILSIYSITSPILSLLLPIIFFLIPFFILKFGKIKITFSTYLLILKQVFSTHAIGNAFINFGDANFEKKIYLCISVSLYLFQIYQNIIICIKFYSNLNKINNTLILIREYIEHTINNYEYFEKLCVYKNIKTYKHFIKKLVERKNELIQYKNKLENIKEWSIQADRIFNIGHSMKCFYMLHNDENIKSSLLYSFGFNGYIDNLRILNTKYNNKELSFCKFSNNKTKFVDAYYYPLLSLKLKPITNTYSLDKQIIITGPNAAGKTTLIKTTFINILFSQQFGLGFYKKATISLFDKLHCYLNIPDTQGRDSLFQAEARRCKNILEIISSNNMNNHDNNNENNENNENNNENIKKEKHFCIFDELYSGTNPYEAISAASSFLKYLNKYNVSYILTTHYIELCNIMENNNVKYISDKEKAERKNKEKYILNCHMETENNDILNDEFIYKYKLKKGISNIKGGVKVLIDLNYPNEIINDTKKLIKNINL